MCQHKNLAVVLFLAEIVQFLVTNVKLFMLRIHILVCLDLKVNIFLFMVKNISYYVQKI